MSKHALGLIADLRDERDHKYSASIEHLQALPTSVDLRPGCAPVENQLALGSCTSFAAGAAIRYARKKQGLPDFVTSHLFLYYDSRSKNTKTVDAGATIRDTIKSAATQGDCPETEWPYDITQFMIRPPDWCYSEAKLDRAINYQRVDRNLNQMKACLASGSPFVAGISVYESFESNTAAQTGVVPMPHRGEEFLGGHAIMCVGFRDDTQKWIFRNSWSDQWGDKGYFYLDYAYLLSSGLSSDFWTINLISG